MKLLLVCIDGLRLDIALPEALQRDPGFTHPDHPCLLYTSDAADE